MKLRRTLFGLVLAAATVGVVGPSTPAQAQCDPEILAVDDGSGSGGGSGCSNYCQSLGAAVQKLTGRSFWDCTQ